MKTIGLIGGMSWESTAVYYRLLNEGVRERVGGLASAKLLLWSADFAEVAEMQARGAWDEAGWLLANAGYELERGGADCLLICTNTMHKVADMVQREITVPLLHIADATAEALTRAGARRPLLLATRYTMEQDFYIGPMRERHGLDVRVPSAADRADVHRIIYDELCRGIVGFESKARYLDIVEQAVRDGADSVIFGCTEVGLLITPQDVPVPAFDSTALHAQAALDFALERPGTRIAA
jgi:aspartate racemase